MLPNKGFHCLLSCNNFIRVTNRKIYKGKKSGRIMEKKKIVIFEDSEIDLIQKYKHFNNEDYETFVYLNSPNPNKEMLKKEGFNNVYQGLPKKLFLKDYVKNNQDRFIDLEKFLSKIKEYNVATKFCLVNRLARKIILNEENPVEADFYYSDGLDYLCFELVKTLQKEKVFINSGNVSIRNEAAKKGYKIGLKNIGD